MNQPVNKELTEGEYPAMVVMTEEKYRAVINAVKSITRIETAKEILGEVDCICEIHAERLRKKYLGESK